jgi:uncharacterized oxidoreductase
MKLTGNTILITGGGSGIGRGLAKELHALGNKVIIAGRRRQLLEAVVAENQGMKFVVLDMEDAASIARVAGELSKDYPALNMLVNNAGIMRAEALREQPLEDAEAIVRTNLLGPIRLTAALLPLLAKQAYSAIVNVSSGLAFVPLSLTPTYCATKAALHSYTQSLRYQLQRTAIEVVELIPPYVATELMNGAEDPRAMPLDEFIAEVMLILKTHPEVKEICVERVKGMRFAAESGKYDAVFSGLNEAMAKLPE